MLNHKLTRVFSCNYVMQMKMQTKEPITKLCNTTCGCLTLGIRVARSYKVNLINLPRFYKRLYDLLTPSRKLINCHFEHLTGDITQTTRQHNISKSTCIYKVMQQFNQKFSTSTRVVYATHCAAPRRAALSDLLSQDFRLTDLCRCK